MKRTRMRTKKTTTLAAKVTARARGTAAERTAMTTPKGKARERTTTKMETKPMGTTKRKRARARKRKTPDIKGQGKGAFTTARITARTFTTALALSWMMTKYLMLAVERGRHD